MKNKVYIVTGGAYSDYSIYEVFSSEEKAKEYIKNKLIIEKDYSFFDKNYFNIEKYNIDNDTDLAEEIELGIEFKYDDNGNLEIIEIEHDISLSIKLEIKERIEYYPKDDYRLKFLGKQVSYPNSYMKIVRIKNKNKDNESEIERIKKIGYDTIKRIKYIREVLGINDIKEINKMINKN